MVGLQVLIAKVIPVDHVKVFVDLVSEVDNELRKGWKE